MRAFYDNKPSKLELVGNGSYIYRWNIEEIEQSSYEDDSTSITQWECQEVTIWIPINSNKITEAVISELWDNNYEQKLVNEYNAAQLGVYSEEESSTKISNYIQFLTDRNNLKNQIDSDCIELGIK